MRILQHQCRQLNRTPVSVDELRPRLCGLLVDDLHKLILLGFPKAGSSTWLLTLIRATGLVPQNATEKNLGGNMHIREIQEKYGLRRLCVYSTVDIQKRLENYFKVIVVRHPLDRLVSVWRDKFIIAKSSSKTMVTLETTAYTNPSQEKTERLLYPKAIPKWTFLEFLYYLLETNTSNIHWASYGKVAPLCSIQWDAVLKTETSTTDSNVVLKRLEPQLNISHLDIVHSHQSRTRMRVPDKALPEYWNLAPAVWKYLSEMYGTDMKLFGYGWNAEKTQTKCASHNCNGLDRIYPLPCCC